MLNKNGKNKYETMANDYSEIQEIEPIFENHYIPVVFATDENYVPYLAVAIQSLIDNSSKNNNYDIVILESNMSLISKNRIRTMIELHKNISIRFYNIEMAVSKYKLRGCSYYTGAMYYRLFMPYIMRKYEKMIYLDCDLVIETDIAKLYDTDIEENYLGAVRDIGMIIHKNNDSNMKFLKDEYFNTALEDIDINTYFNSGVLLMNLKAFRNNFNLDFLIQSTNRKEFIYPDQDGLNNICKNKTYMLDISWNTSPYNTGTRTNEYINRYVPESIRTEYFKARENPQIIHYNMLEKPWLHPCSLDFSLMSVFWKYASRTPFLKDIIFKRSNFYSSTHKEKIQYFEYREILRKFTNKECKQFENMSDIYFLCGEYLLCKLSNIFVKYETLDIKQDSIYINASIVIGIEEFSKIESICFVNKKNGVEYHCDISPCGTGYTFEDKIIGQKYVFSANVPLNILPAELELYFVVNKKYYLARKFNYSINFPIDRLNPYQFFIDKNIILTLKSNKLFFEEATFSKTIKKELKYDFSLIKQKGKKNKVAVLIRILVSLLNKFKRKPIWIIGCNYLGEDNGMAFFRYLQTKRKYVKSYFVITDKKSLVAKRAKLYGKVIDRNSRRFQLLMLLSSISVDSIVDLRLIRPFKNFNLFRDILLRRKFVFLQHGITTQDQSREHNRLIYNPAIFCVSSKAEYEEYMQQKYFYTNQIKLTGLTRFDFLYNDPQKIITIMPTWRKWYNGDYGSHTDFYKFYFALLHNMELQTILKEYGYKLWFKPHPNVVRSCDINIYKQNEGDDSFEFCEKSYTEIYAQSNLIVTDYSSAIFDFLYLNKPVIFAQFDAEEFFSGKHVYTRGFIDYKTNGFGDVADNLEQTVSLIMDYIKNNCKMKDLYKERIDNFFAFNDQNNCERVYNAITELEK